MSNTIAGAFLKTVFSLMLLNPMLLFSRDDTPVTPDDTPAAIDKVPILRSYEAIDPSFYADLGFGIALPPVYVGDSFAPAIEMYRSKSYDLQEISTTLFRLTVGRYLTRGIAAQFVYSVTNDVLYNDAIGISMTAIQIFGGLKHHPFGTNFQIACDMGLTILSIRSKAEGVLIEARPFFGFGISPSASYNFYFGNSLYLAPEINYTFHVVTERETDSSNVLMVNSCNFLIKIGVAL